MKKQLASDMRKYTEVVKRIVKIPVVVPLQLGIRDQAKRRTK